MLSTIIIPVLQHPQDCCEGVGFRIQLYGAYHIGGRNFTLTETTHLVFETMVFAFCSQIEFSCPTVFKFHYHHHGETCAIQSPDLERVSSADSLL